MNKYYYIFLLPLALSINTYAQNNYVFNGGPAHGFSQNSTQTLSNNSIFAGSDNDGFDHDHYTTISLNWNGGADDGFSSSTALSIQPNSIYNGSNDDGMAFLTFSQKSNNEYYYGGVDDGFSHAILSSAISDLAYDGGEGDGFSASGISKLIWDGDLNNDWLMADNWNIPIVPTMYHFVCIPGGAPRYPILNGVLGVSIDEAHIYASSDIEIMDGAQVNGIQNVKIIVNGDLLVAGNLLIDGTGAETLIGRKNGLIRILSGGSIVID